jgi:hypothetical protein
MARFLFCIVALLWFSGFSAAQSRDRVEIFGGYSFMVPDFTGTSSNASGWDVSANVNLVRHVGVVADFSGFYPSGSNGCNCGAAVAAFHSYMVGPQASLSIGRIKPFARFLIGATIGSYTHADSQGGSDFTQISYGGGGGVDYGFNRWFAVRGQADWLHTGSVNGGSGNVARLAAGLVFRF